MSTLVFFEKDSLVEDWEAGVDNAKVEIDQSLAVRSYNRFNIVKVLKLFVVVQSTLMRKVRCRQNNDLNCYPPGLA